MIEILSRSQAGQPGDFARAFGELPEKLRAQNAAVGLPPGAVWQRFLDLAPASHAEFWLAFAGAKPIGRIGASLLPRYPGSGAVGFFEATPDAEKPLLDAALAWLKGRGMTKAFGPLNLNTWFPYRFRTDDDERAFSWEPNQPESYPRAFREAGFTACEEYFSVGSAGLPAYVEKTEPAYRNALEKGYTFRPFDGTHLLEKEVPILFELSMAGFKDNYLFEPITLQAFRELYVPLAKKMDFSSCFFAIAPNGKECGFFFAFPDREYLVFKSMTILDSCRGMGISNALTYLAAKLAVDRGLTRYVSALVRRGNRSESYQKKGETLWVHTYELMERSLDL